MRRCTFTLKMLRTLSLTFLMVWLWQASALLTGIEAPVVGVLGQASTSTNIQAASTSCVLCTADNQSSSTADHAHEPPSLVAMAVSPAYERTDVPADVTVHRNPKRFIDLIERPPRSSLLI